MAAIRVGDKFKLTGKFLKFTGQQTGSAGQSKWTAVECGCGLCKLGDFVAGDERRDDALPDESPWRHFNRANVYRVGTLDVRNDP